METYIKSPLNYRGGKYKLLPTLFPLFPQEIDRFVDLFCGGFNVGVNGSANKILANDRLNYVIELYNYFKITLIEEILEGIQTNIEKYNLSKTNLEGYLALRKDYNSGSRPPIDLFTLICYSFNNDMRFSKKTGFNMPFGKRDFNPTIKQSLRNFVEAIQTKDIEFINKDFSEVEIKDSDFVYCDPPYLIGTATYNTTSGGWSEEDDSRLFEFLDSLTKRNIKFALSDVFENKGLVNNNLINWSKSYNIYYISEADYTSSAAYRKNRDKKTVEVLITNY